MRFCCRHLVLICCLSLTFAQCGEVLAQNFGGGGDSAFGQSSGGGFGGTGQSAFGQSSFGQSGFDQGGFGQSGAGATTGPSITSGETGFIGRDATDIQAYYEAIGRQLQQAVTAGGRAGRGSSNINTDDVGRPPVRVKLTVGNALRPSGQQVVHLTTKASERVGRLLGQRNLNGVTFENNQGAARLSGMVSSDEEKRLAEAIASIEPGVRSVDNQLQVVPSEAVPTPAAE